MPAASAARPPDSREFKGSSLNVSGIGTPRKNSAELEKQDDPAISGSTSPKSEIGSPGKREKRGRDIEDQENVLESASPKRRRWRISEGSIFNIPAPSAVPRTDGATPTTADTDASDVADARTEAARDASVKGDADSEGTSSLERADGPHLSATAVGPSRPFREDEDEEHVAKTLVAPPLSNIPVSLIDDEAEELSFDDEDSEDEEVTFDIPTLEEDEVDDPSYHGSSDDGSVSTFSSSDDEKAANVLWGESEDRRVYVEILQESQRERGAMVEGEPRIINHGKHIRRVGISAELRNLPKKRCDSHCTKRSPESSRCIVWFWEKIPSRKAPVSVKDSTRIPKKDLKGVERYPTLDALLKTFRPSSQQDAPQCKFGGLVPPKENHFRCRYGDITTIEGEEVIWNCRFRYSAAQLADEAPGKPVREHLKTAHGIQDVQWEKDWAESCRWVSCRKFMHPPVGGIAYHGSHFTGHAYRLVCPFYSQLLRQRDGSYVRACVNVYDNKRNLRNHLSGRHKVVIDSLSQRMHSEWDRLAVGDAVELSFTDGL